MGEPPRSADQRERPHPRTSIAAKPSARRRASTRRPRPQPAQPQAARHRAGSERRRTATHARAGHAHRRGAARAEPTGSAGPPTDDDASSHLPGLPAASCSAPRPERRRTMHRTIRFICSQSELRVYPPFIAVEYRWRVGALHRPTGSPIGVGRRRSRPRAECSMTVAADEHERTHGVRGDRSRPDQGAAPARFAAPFRNLVQLRHRLQSVVEPDDQRNAGAQRHAQRSRHRPDLRNLHFGATRFTDRIDRVGSQVMGEIEQVMAMIGAAAGNASSYSENLATVTQKPRRRRRRARGARHRRKPGARHQGNGEEQPGAGGAAVGVEAGDQPAAGKSRSGAQREPDRSAHHARQPQIFRRRAGQGDRGRAAAKASRCRC